ncbi:hypothetical protein C8R44DRAFT_892844 [Mycena epipterygia]|nr:hypothetical protein C8R44DRAFT_892844 [Mycena epipterygia]
MRNFTAGLIWAVSAWFHKWPEHTSLGLLMANDSGARPLTDAEMLLLGAAIKQLKNWFRNHRKKIGDATAAAVQTRSTAALFKNIFKLNAPKRRRAHQPVEHFQLRNADLIAKALNDEGYNVLTLEGMEDVDWTNEADSTEVGRNKRLKSDRMRLRMRVVSALWAEADDDEKEAVEALVEAEKEVIRVEELKAEAELDPSVPDARTVWEMQDGIDALEPVYTEVHRATFNASGWVGMTIVGGPNPRMGGEFSYKIVCFGETPAGNDFEDSCADFDKNVTEPFEEFFSTVFSNGSRTARSDGDADEAVPATPPKKAHKRAPRRKKGPAGATIAAIAPVAAVPVVGSVEGDIACSTPSSTPTPSDTVGSHSPHSDSFPASVLLCFTPHLSSADEGDILDGFSIGDMFDGFNFDTMMLDPAASSSPPLLSPPSSPSSASAAPVSPFTLRPIPRPTYKGATYVPLAALETANVGGYNFPLESPPHSQAISTSLAPTALAPAPGMPSTGTFTSMMAHAMYKIINQPAPTTAPRVAPTTPAPVPTAPVVVARAPTTPAVVAPAPAPAIVAPAPTPAVVVPVPAPAPAIVAPAPTPAVVVPVPAPAPAIVAPAPTPALVAPAPTIPVILATASAIPIVTATSIIPVVANEFPKSRPLAKVPTVKKGAAVKDAAAAPKTRAKAAKKTGQLKAGTVAAEKQLAAVTTAQKVVEVEEKVKKRRGQPRKIVVEESGGDEGVAVEESAGGEVAVKRGRGRPKKIVVESARGEGAAASAASTVTAPIAPLAPALIYSMPGNNTMAFNRAVEKRRAQEISEKAARKKAEENAALLVQAAKGWHTAPNPNGETETVILTRARKPTRFVDGTVLTRQVKNTRANPHAASEAALLARTEEGKRKREATENTSEASGRLKRRKSS